MEPYAYAQFITGKDHPYKFGRARNSWLTGTATWAFVALSQYILGVRPDYNGLIVDPQVPSTWSEYQVTRRFRGATYRIEVVGSGKITQVLVDGEPLPVPSGGKKLHLPIAAPGSTVQVRILRGQTSR